MAVGNEDALDADLIDRERRPQLPGRIADIDVWIDAVRAEIRKLNLREIEETEEARDHVARLTETEIGKLHTLTIHRLRRQAEIGHISGADARRVLAQMTLIQSTRHLSSEDRYALSSRIRSEAAAVCLTKLDWIVATLRSRLSPVYLRLAWEVLVAIETLGDDDIADKVAAPRAFVERRTDELRADRRATRRQMDDVDRDPGGPSRSRPSSRRPVDPRGARGTDDRGVADRGTPHGGRRGT